MKRPTTKKSTPLTFAKKRAIAHTKIRTNKARAKRLCAQMPDYLLEEHPELMITEALPVLPKMQRKP